MVLGLSDDDIALVDDRGKIYHLFVGRNSNNEASQYVTDGLILDTGKFFFALFSANESIMN